MSDYTPTTAHVREVFSNRPGSYYAKQQAIFNRWLTAHDAQICVDTFVLKFDTFRQRINNLEAEVAATRTAALEEAAEIADRYDKGYAQHPNDGIVKFTQAAIAKAIRTAKVADS